MHLLHIYHAYMSVDLQGHRGGVCRSSSMAAGQLDMTLCKVLRGARQCADTSSSELAFGSLSHSSGSML